MTREYICSQIREISINGVSYEYVKIIRSLLHTLIQKVGNNLFTISDKQIEIIKEFLNLEIRKANAKFTLTLAENFIYYPPHSIKEINIQELIILDLMLKQIAEQGI